MIKPLELPCFSRRRYGKGGHEIDTAQRSTPDAPRLTSEHCFVSAQCDHMALSLSSKCRDAARR